MLKDRFNRIHDYLRISLTDSCNFRCSYCMPEENISCMPQPQLMQPEEIEAIAQTFVGLGVRKIRLTGGEPLVRKGAGDIIRRLSKLPVELTLTTNGVLADKYIETFKEAGIRSLNVSLDTLQQAKFFRITRRDALPQVWKNILLLIEDGFHVKLNVVVMKGVNEEEINQFIGLTKDLPLHVRFIEFMPFSGNRWQNKQVYTAQQMLRQAEEAFSFIKLKDEKHATAKKYKVLNHEGTYVQHRNTPVQFLGTYAQPINTSDHFLGTFAQHRNTSDHFLGTFAFITTMSQPFCGDCNRMRLTADGKMKNCLFGKDELNLLEALRRGESILPLIEKSLMMKFEKMGGQFQKSYQETDGAAIENRSMIKIGG